MKTTKQTRVPKTANGTKCPVRSLPPKYAVPLSLYTYERLSYLEIAEALDISLSAVEARIHRARKKLIKILEPWVGRI